MPALLWKEWKENLWKLTFCIFTSLAFTALLFRMRIIPDQSNCLVISFIQLFVVPVVYALDIFSGEMTNRTVHLLFKIPVPRWKLFFSKYVVSALGIAAVFLITGLLMESIARGRETAPGYLLAINARFGAAALVLYTCFCAFGCQTRTEAASLVVMFAVFIGWGIVYFWAAVSEIKWGIALAPYGVFAPHSVEAVRFVPPAMVLIGQILVFLLALAAACWRYAKIRRYL